MKTYTIPAFVLLGIIFLFLFNQQIAAGWRYSAGFLQEQKPVPAAVLEVLERLSSTPLPATHASHTGSHSMEIDTIVEEIKLTPDEQKLFDVEWAEAVQAMEHLNTTSKALAAGYMSPRATERAQTSIQHWINWELVEKPFNPAMPAMLLFSTHTGKEKLVGFSYYLQSVDEPDGFTGMNDRWHQHFSICISEKGRVLLGDSAPQKDCDGFWLPGHDLWMLHAWLVPEYPHPLNRFSLSNPTVCTGVCFGAPTSSSFPTAFPVGD